MTVMGRMKGWFVLHQLQQAVYFENCRDLTHYLIGVILVSVSLNNGPPYLTYNLTGLCSISHLLYRYNCFRILIPYDYFSFQDNFTNNFVVFYRIEFSFTSVCYQPRTSPCYNHQPCSIALWLRNELDPNLEW